MNGIGRLATAAALALLVAAPLAAQGVPPLVTDRPDQTESPSVVPRGMVQFEVGSLHQVADGGAGRTTSVASLLARVALADRVELRLGFLGWQHEAVPGVDRAGLGDLSVGFKVALLRGDGLAPAAAVLTSVRVPVGHRDFRAAGVDPEMRVALAHELSSGFSLGYNVGAAWVTSDDGAGAESTHAEGFYTLTLGRALGERLGAFVEAFGSVAPSDAYPWSHALDGGATFGVGPNVQLDAALGVGLNAAAPDWFLGLGISARIPR